MSELNEHELKILRQVAGLEKLSPWGAGIGACLEFLHENGYVTGPLGGKLTDKGRAALGTREMGRRSSPVTLVERLEEELSQAARAGESEEWKIPVSKADIREIIRHYRADAALVCIKKLDETWDGVPAWIDEGKFDP